MDSAKPFDEVVKPSIPFRIQFSTETIKPTSLPDFTYVSSMLLFDCVVYTAVVWETGPLYAVTKVMRYWPNACIRFLEQGEGAFHAHDYMSKPVEYGSYLAKPSKPWFRRLFIKG